MPHDMRAEYAERPRLDKMSVSDNLKLQKRRSNQRVQDTLVGDAPHEYTSMNKKRVEKEFKKMLLQFMRVPAKRAEDEEWI